MEEEKLGGGAMLSWKHLVIYDTYQLHKHDPPWWLQAMTYCVGQRLLWGPEVSPNGTNPILGRCYLGGH